MDGLTAVRPRCRFWLLTLWPKAAAPRVSEPPALSQVSGAWAAEAARVGRVRLAQIPTVKTRFSSSSSQASKNEAGPASSGKKHRSEVPIERVSKVVTLRLEAIAIRLEAIAIRMEGPQSGYSDSHESANSPLISIDSASEAEDYVLLTLLALPASN